MGKQAVPAGGNRIAELLQALVKLQIAPILRRELDDDFKRKLYALTGEATTREIQTKLKCRPSRICDTWGQWEQLGLIVKNGRYYRKVV